MMKYLKHSRKLGRKKANRQHLIRNLATQTLLHGRIKTTLAKAKRVQPVVERLISISQKKSLSARRYLLAYLSHSQAVEKLLADYREDFKSRNSGFSKIIRLKKRLGDNSELAFLDLAIAEDKKSYAKALEKRKKKQKEEKKQKKRGKESSEKKRSFLERLRRRKKPTERETKKREEGGEKPESIHRTTSK